MYLVSVLHTEDGKKGIAQAKVVHIRNMNLSYNPDWVSAWIYPFLGRQLRHFEFKRTLAFFLHVLSYFLLWKLRLGLFVHCRCLPQSQLKPEHLKKFSGRWCFVLFCFLLLEVRVVVPGVKLQNFEGLFFCRKKKKVALFFSTVWISVA